MKSTIQQIRQLSKAPKKVPYDATKYRRWIKLRDQVGDNSFQVMSFNLLSRHYVWSKIYGDLKHPHLQWNNHRFPLINKTISQLNCDIMCFQEMEYGIYKNYWKKTLLKQNYSSEFVQKSLPLHWGKKPRDHIDGVSIFYNNVRFKLLDWKQINYSQYIKQNDFEITEDVTKRVLPRNTVALLVKLQDKISGEIIFVTNTHLYWNPKFNDVKLIQTKILLDILHDFTAGCDNPYIIMTGDFNSNSSSWVIDFLNSSQFDLPNELVENYGCDNQLITKDHKLINPIQLYNTYQTLLDNDQLTFTSYTKEFSDVLDHIFINKNLFVINKLLSEVDESYHCAGFPSEQFPSDHIPLVVELSYK